MIHSVIKLLFDPRGRAGRGELLVSGAVMLGLELLSIGLTSQFGDGASFGVIAIKTLEVLIGLSATSKRLHDTGKSSLWLLAGAAIICMWTAVIAIGGVTLVGRDVLQVGSISHLIILGLVMVPPLAMTLWLHLVRGDAFKNKYGYPPVSILGGFGQSSETATSGISDR